MSENPTSLLCRAAVGGAVVAAALALPAAAVAKKDGDKGKKDASPACADAKQSKHPHGGPPGQTKKADQKPECADHTPNGGPGGDGGAGGSAQPVVVNVTVAAPPAPAAPAAAPVSAAASSQSLGKCEKRKTFRITLYKGRARSARVMLNGRAIPVTRGKKKTSVLLDMRGRKNQNFTVRHTVVTKTGKLKTGTRRFRTCG